MVNAPVQTARLTIEEFIQFYDEGGPFEIIEGERITLMPPLSGHSYTGHNLLKALIMFLASNDLGEVMYETAFVLPDANNTNRVAGSRVPDLMFISANRLAAYRTQTPDWKEKPYLIAPNLVVEIVLPGFQIIISSLFD